MKVEHLTVTVLGPLVVDDDPNAGPWRWSINLNGADGVELDRGDAPTHRMAWVEAGVAARRALDELTEAAS